MGNKKQVITSGMQLGALDRAFADFICRLAGVESPALWLAAAFASNAAGNGSACFRLADFAGERGIAAAECAGIAGFDDPHRFDPERLGEELLQYNVVRAPGGFAPLVLDSSLRLYLHRYWGYENSLGTNLLRMASETRGDLDKELLSKGMEILFPSSADDHDTDWQRVAALIAVKRSLTVVAGGPGTGKTTTVVKILALLLEQSREQPLRIALAAPTGKAAARLMEAISKAGESLELPEKIRSGIPDVSFTLHRLLGYVHGSVQFRHNAENPLPFDVVVVDESSMVDLPMMAKLVAAIKPGSRLLLLGDRDQLASVEAGAVLGDICHPDWQNSFSPSAYEAHKELTGTDLPGAPVLSAPPLSDSIVTLKKSHRFSGTSGIAAVSRLVNEGRGAEALDLMQSGVAEDIHWRELPTPDLLPSQLKSVLMKGYGGYLAGADPADCLERFGSFRILSPVRQGAYGVGEINTIAERVLGIKKFRSGGPEWYPFRPVLVSRNDYHFGLSNGDIGITLPDDTGALSVCFPSSDGGIRRFSPLTLQACDTVFAMTVHKSQGSEFDSLLIILPPASGDILTRELLYTAITRGRKRIEIWGVGESFIAAVGRRIERNSGLRERLWG